MELKTKHTTTKTINSIVNSAISNISFNSYSILEFKNQRVIRTNLYFNLIEAEFTFLPMTKGFENKNEVFILQLKLVDLNIDVVRRIAYRVKRGRLESDFKDYEPFMMKNLGYIYNIEQKELSLVYLKDKANVIDFDNIQQKYENNQTIFKMDIIFPFIEFITKLHRSNKLINLIHPDLIFFSKNKGFKYIEDIICRIYCV